MYKRQYTKRTTSSNILRLIFAIIFYIPCLLRDLFTYLHRQFKLSTPIEWTILSVELLIIGAYYVLPILYNAIMTSRGTLLLNDPVYTNKLMTIETKDKLHSQGVQIPDNPDVKSGSKSSKKLYNYNYAISVWSYINPQPPNTSRAYEEFTPLFSYGKKPEFFYKGKTDEFKIETQDKKGEPRIIYHDKNIPLQRWNHFVINYDGGTLDIFLNNKLVSSEKNVAPYSEYDSLNVGSQNGVHGGICNIQYFDYVLSRREISLLHNSVKFKNPPTI